MDILSAIAVLWPRIWILIVTGVIAAAGALVATGFLPLTYESSATLLVGQSSGAPPVVYEDLLTAQILAATYAALATTTPVLDAAREQSGISISVEELRDRVRVEGVRNSPLIVVTTTFPTANEAASAANAVAEETAAIGASEGESLQVSVVDPAEPPRQPISPRPQINALVAGGIGVLVSAGLILAFSTPRSRQRKAMSDSGDRSAIGELR